MLESNWLGYLQLKKTQNKNRNNGGDQCEDCVLILEKDLRSILNDTFLKRKSLGM